jgi:RNA polymerase sigma-70 factor, ECF subfamily
MEPEESLFVHIKCGDKKAFESLFRSYFSHLCAFANTYIGDLDASQDLVQEFLFHIWQKKEDLPADVPVRGYLFKAVQNRCLNLLKHNKIKERHKDFTLQQFKENLYGDDGQEVNELHEKIRQTIDRLPPERRKVFVLHRYEDLKYKEIAEKLNISIKTVENQIGKALSFLREELKDYLPILVLVFIEIMVKFFKPE